MAVSEDAVAVLAAKFAVMRKVADERTWRVYLGSEALALGRGGSRRWRGRLGAGDHGGRWGVRDRVR